MSYIIMCVQQNSLKLIQKHYYKYTLLMPMSTPTLATKAILKAVTV